MTLLFLQKYPKEHLSSGLMNIPVSRQKCWAQQHLESTAALENRLKKENTYRRKKVKNQTYENKEEQKLNSKSLIYVGIEVAQGQGLHFICSYLLGVWWSWSHTLIKISFLIVVSWLAKLFVNGSGQRGRINTCRIRLHNTVYVEKTKQILNLTSGLVIS